MKCPKQASLWRLKVDEWMQRVRGRWGKPANKYRVSFWGDESVSKLIVVMLHNFEYTKHHWTEYFKWDEFYSMQNYVWIKLLFYKRKRLKGILGRNHSWKPLSTKACLGDPEQTCVAGTWSGNAEHGMQNGGPQRNTALPTLWLEPSEINMCCFQPPVLWSFGYSRSRELIQVSIILTPEEPHIFERYLICLKSFTHYMDFSPTISR